MANNEQIKLQYVQGIGKKSGSTYYALEVDFPTVNGGRYKKLLFLNMLEMQLINLSPEQFKQREMR